jgi:hypothetical protein
MINAVRSDQTKHVQCDGHDLENCHLLINMVKGLNFIKSFPNAVSKIRQSHKTFIHHHHTHTGEIYHATHATFDEAELSSDSAVLTPNSCALWNALSRDPGAGIASEAILEPPKDLCVFSSDTPFLHISQVVIPIKCTLDDLDLVLGPPVQAQHHLRRPPDFFSLSLGLAGHSPVSHHRPSEQNPHLLLQRGSQGAHPPQRGHR